MLLSFPLLLSLLLLSERFIIYEYIASAMPDSSPRSPRKCSGLLGDWALLLADEEAVGADMDGAKIGVSKPALPARRVPDPPDRELLSALVVCTCGDILLLDLANGFIRERKVDAADDDWLIAEPAAVFIEDSCGEVGRSLC